MKLGRKSSEPSKERPVSETSELWSFNMDVTEPLPENNIPFPLRGHPRPPTRIVVRRVVN